MKKLLLPIVACSLLVACSSSSTTDTTANTAAGIPRSVNEVVVAGTPVTMADLSIDGMTCEMMCGGSIKKALANLPGVSTTDIKFTEDASADHAIVTFDAAQVSEAEIVKAVEALHEGQYKVSAIAITKQVQGTPAADATEEPAEKVEGQISASLPELVLPSVFGFLSRLLRI